MVGGEMNNEPVAMRYDFDGYGYQYIDSGSGSDWLTRVDGELLYTRPSEHDLGVAEAVGFDKGYKAATAKTLTEIIEKNKPEIEKANAYIKSLEDEIEALKAKTLTDEEIWEVINRTAWVGTEEEIRFKIAEAILRKARQE
jgi:hypothetical protein